MPIDRARLSFLPLICLALTGLIAGCTGPVPPAAGDDVVIYVIKRDWHTDIGLSAEVIAAPLQSLTAAFPGVRFLTFGFGERQFLVDQDRSAGAMLRALLPSESAVLMTALRAAPGEAFGRANVVALRVSRTGLKAIEDRIWREFELSPAGSPVLLAGGPYPGSVYYAASDIYSGLFTCNTWTADVLQAGGLPVHAFGVLFSGQVMGQAHWIDMHQISSLADDTSPR